MGLMDSFVSGLKKVAEEVDKQAGLSGENSLSNLASQAQQAFNEAIGDAQSSESNTSFVSEGGAPAQSADTSARSSASGNSAASGNGAMFGARTPEYILNDTAPVTSYEVMEDVHFWDDEKHIRTMELPEGGFDPGDSGALEISTLFIYRSGDDDYHNGFVLTKPAILVQDPDARLTDVGGRTPVSHGIMTFRSEGWVNCLGHSHRYYIFTDHYGNEQLFLLECLPDIVGSPAEKKIINIFDHAAETFREG